MFHCAAESPTPVLAKILGLCREHRDKMGSLAARGLERLSASRLDAQANSAQFEARPRS